MKIQLVARIELHNEDIKNLGVPDRWNENDMFEMSEDVNDIVVFRPLASNSAGTKCDISLQKQKRCGACTICSQDNETVLFIEIKRQIVLLFRSEEHGPTYMFLLFEKLE